MSDKENQSDWKQKLFEISTQNLIRRDKLRQQVELERLVRDEIDRDLLLAPEIKDRSIGK